MGFTVQMFFHMLRFFWLFFTHWNRYLVLMMATLWWFSFLNLFYLYCVCLNIHLCTILKPDAQWMPKEGIRSFETRVTDSCEHVVTCECWEWNPILKTRSADACNCWVIFSSPMISFILLWIKSLVTNQINHSTRWDHKNFVFFFKFYNFKFYICLIPISS